LKDYIKHTTPEHIDYKNIEKALEMFSKVNDENNKHMDRVVVNAKMFEIQKALGDTPKVKVHLIILFRLWIQREILFMKNQ